ncbi:hypothetical protein [Mycobacterium sp. 236(2023)]|uniref:hypothetical protein n=1 Tax=Mycobacterium sp. 236(2023) TaxID=3038163 RepID=UPI0024154262|nr:hypothetical protein [Mycobacterium sp. 236(2023)]MDG4667037.1 hypothetical protein [Mycobacterium sp. 236(2023)]
MGLVIRLAELLLILAPLIGVGYATFRAIVGARGNRSDHGTPHRGVIDRAVKEHDRTDTRWLEYEIDVAKILECPLMTDMREPLTQRFHAAKVRADLLRPTDAVDLVDDRDAISGYLDAVQEYVTTFDVAEAEAIRRGRSGFTAREQERLGRAQRLLRVAADTAATQQERAGAYQLARRELEGLLVLPERALAALQRGVSGELG